MKSSLLLLLIPACTFISDADVDAKFGSVDDTGSVTDDADGDGYALSVDCDETDPGVHPGATEVWYDGVDQNCDGASDFDQDGDSFDSELWPNNDGVYGDDCYDEIDSGCVTYNGTEADCSYPVSGSFQGEPIDPFDIHPSATDTWYDGTDQDCGGNDDYDQDHDGFASYAECDDTNPDIYPNPDIPEVWYNGIDENCDGNDADQDGDSFLDAGYSGGYVHDPSYYSIGDCWDDPADSPDWVPVNSFPALTAEQVNPAADETWYDGLDQDCAGNDDFDQDADGFDADGYLDASGAYGDDCDDLAGDTNPGAVDAWYDGIDADCAGNNDFDEDGDGYGEDGSGLGVDCDDTRVGVNPGATEECATSYDDDCDGDVNDLNAVSCTVRYYDADRDTYGTTATECRCEASGDYDASVSTDCDDADTGVNPGAVETCATLYDDDCDGSAATAGDGPAPAGCTDFFIDADADSWGGSSSVCACGATGSYTATADDDCDDSLPDVNPAASEVCDGLDNNCDGTVDEADAVDATLWCEDADLDGYCGTVTMVQCDSPGSTWSATNPTGDCDESDAAVFPGATETCDGLDDNCDGTVDEADALDATLWCEDADLDSYCGTVTTVQCDSPGSTWSATNPSGDCDDANAAIFAGATEVCSDGVDDDCDGGDVACSTFADYSTAYGSVMVAIPPGTFTMGGGLGDPYSYYTDHDVTLTHNFWIGETEITRGQWESWSGGSGWTYTSESYGYPCTTSTTTADCPADSISWHDAAQYANALSTAEGLANCYLSDGTVLAAAYLTDPYSCPGYRMPTEAEWEYAARAGEDTTYSGSNTVGDVAWYYDNAYALGTYAHEVATLAPNAWGLYDMSGNEFEWTDDWYSVSYGGYGDGGAQTDPPGPSSGSYIAIRGASFTNLIWASTLSYRQGEPSAADYGVGLRLARTIPIPSTPTVTLSPTSPTDSDDLTCTASGSTDIDGDTVSYTYAWTVNGVASTIATDTVPAASTTTGDTWTCSATATDGTDSSAAVTASVTVAADTADYTTSYGSRMVAIPAGTFTMGGGLGDPDSSYTDHSVTLTHDFWMGETELTRGAWESWSGGSGWTFTYYACTTSTTTADCPADSISWVDVAQYANALSTAEGLTNCYLSDGTDLATAYLTDPYSCPGYRLPTEAEWEYAAQAGEDTTYSGSNSVGDVAWYSSNAYWLGTYSHEVATLAPNAWGLYDMSGNLWEWTDDGYDAGYGGYGSGASASDPPGPSSTSIRVIRGGTWIQEGSYATVAYRGYDLPSAARYINGARLSRSIP